jgi:hypothetical protein
MKTIPVIEVLAGGELTRRCRNCFFRGEAERRRTLLRRQIMKKKLLRFAALMIALAFVFAGTACRGGDVVVDIGHDTPAPTTKPTTAPTSEPTPEPTAEPTPEPTPAPVHATLMFVGDLMCLSSQQRGAKQQAGGSGYDFSPSFAYVREVFNNADCVIGNLETSLSHSWPYATEQRNIGGMPNCNGPKQYLGALKFAGFDALVLANNHCCDAGVQGIIETTQAVEEYGFPYTGLFREKDAQRFVILDVKGIKVGLLSYAEFYNSKDKAVREAGCEYMINTYSKERIAEDIAAARAAGAELIVAYNHWGAEHTHQPTPKVVTHAQEMADAGVDIIIGSHSHAVQPVVWLTAADGRQVLCAYSMGNFVSSMGRSTANDTFIAEIGIVREGGSVRVESEKYHPCRVFPQLKGYWYVVVPTNVTIVTSIIPQLKAAEERITAIVNPEGR